MRKTLWMLACGSLWLTGANALASDDFEVLVMRGSTLVRVTGDERGPLSEVTIREDPTPPAREVEWKLPAEPAKPVDVVIQIVRDEPRFADGWGFFHGHSHFARHHKGHHFGRRGKGDGFRKSPWFGHRFSRGRGARGL